MGNSATEIMLQKVEEARSRARSAERSFDYANDSIQRKASRSIDLFGGSASSTVVEIASDARRACDDLYSAYQNEIKVLDSECRPLLEKKPSLQAVREVYKLIEWLNDESEIENNFSASLNYQSLGNVASAKYVPSMSNKMIQRFWESQYNSHPGRAQEAEEEAKRRRIKAEEAKERREREEASRREKELLKEEAERELRNDILDKADLLEEDIDDYLDREDDRQAEKEKKLKGEIQELNDRLRIVQRESAGLGLFKIKEKLNAKQETESLQKQIEQKNEEIRKSKLACEVNKELIECKIEMFKAEAGDELVFGTSFYSQGLTAMKWKVVENDGLYVSMIAKNIVALEPYHRSLVWLADDFSNTVFTAGERGVLESVNRNRKNRKVFLPSEGEVRQCFNSLGAAPEKGLTAYIDRKHREDGKKYNYNALQIENGIKSDMDRAHSYWLYTSSDDRSGFSNYVSSSGSGGVVGKIGSGAPFGVRPMIKISLEKLIECIEK